MMASSSSNIPRTAFMSFDEYVDSLRIPYEEIESATNNFGDENLIARGSCYDVYKGQLRVLHSSGEHFVNIVARRSRQYYKYHVVDNELAISKYLEHNNISSVFKIGDYRGTSIIINKYEANGSLDKHLSTLTWMQRLKICLGVAKALSYIHYYNYNGFDDHYIVHGTIKSSKILLDHNLEPKLYSFGYATRLKRYHGYFSSIYKSDLFSFGVVLFELLLPRKASTEKTENLNFIRFARLHYEERTLDDMIDPDLRKQMDLQSLNIFSETAYYCLKELRGESLNTHQIVKRLERALELQQKHHILIPPERSIKNSFFRFISKAQSTTAVGSTLSNHLMEHYDFLGISVKEVEPGTNNFSSANLIAQGSSFKVYKGLLWHSGHLIDIVARKSLPSHYVQAIKEVTISQYFKHKNICSIYKLAEQDDKTLIIINKHEANESLNKHLRGSTLTWMQRLQICLGVAHTLSYIHYHAEDGYYFIHGNIKSSKILLDNNWEPKLHGFGFAHRVKRNHSYLTSKYNGTLQYMDPAYEKTKTLTYKSDVFSFGVVLFEILFSRRAYLVPNMDNWYFARLARLHYEERTLGDMIDPDLRKQMDLESLKIFSEVAYYCLKEQRGERPDMDQIVKRLETSLELQQKHQTPVSPFPPKNNKRNPLFRFILNAHSTSATGSILSNRLERENLNHLKIQLGDIELATNNFSIDNCIGQGGYGIVYKAELDHYDGKNIPAIEIINKGKFPKRRSTVAIKRLIRRGDGQEEQGFLSEIDMLSKCKHRNIVSLLGFCGEDDERILVYEHVSNGSLSDYLGNINNMTNLTWGQRIEICIDIANGLNYLHTSTQEKEMIIHRDIKSDNILLDDNWVAKIADFGLSKLHGNRVAYDEIFNANNDSGLPSTVRRCFNEGTFQEIIDPKLKEAHEFSFMLNGGLNQDSLDTFINIAYQCLSNIQAERPTTKVIIQELEKALNFHKNSKDNLQICQKDIKPATQNIGKDKWLGEGRYWKQYDGEIPHADTSVCTKVIVKRFESKSIQGNHQFLRELKALLECKHENIVALVGYCNEMDEKIIMYEHALTGTLDKHLSNASLTWMRRLKICIDVVSGLAFLHMENMIHRDIKSASILIDSDWKAKISNLELTTGYMEIKEIEHVTSSMWYVDPLYKIQGYFTYGSDIYSLGVVLIEMLSGRLVSTFEESVSDLVQKCKRSAKAFEELVFEEIKQRSAPDSLTTFFEIASGCLDLDDDKRPNAASLVLIQLKKALALQEDYEIWEPKLPTDYKEIILMSNTPEMYSNKLKKDIYHMFTKGILLQQGKSCLILGSNGERNEMISATNFSYKTRCPYRWPSHPKSRFCKVAEVLDISNLMILIKTIPQFLTPNVVYGVHLVFKFCDSRHISSKPMYVNLRYKTGNHTLHSYFATWRDDDWMMIELYRFLNQKEDVVFKVSLESLSPYYKREHDSIYIEGIEFRAIDNVKHGKVETLKEVQEVSKSNLNVYQPQQLRNKSEERFKRSENYFAYEELFSSEVNGKKHVIFSAKTTLYEVSDLNLFHSRPSTESRFQEVIELLSQPVFRIDCTIKSKMLSQDTIYACYLVFKLSEKCQGLHCPVEVRDLLHRENKDAEIIYFKPPRPWNILDITRVPEQREDGWMEVNVWKFNSQHEVRNNSIPVKLKLISYEGTMSGLIICGVEFRPM